MLERDIEGGSRTRTLSRAQRSERCVAAVTPLRYCVRLIMCIYQALRDVYTACVCSVFLKIMLPLQERLRWPSSQAW